MSREHFNLNVYCGKANIEIYITDIKSNNHMTLNAHSIFYCVLLFDVSHYTFAFSHCTFAFKKIADSLSMDVHVECVIVEHIVHGFLVQNW